MSEIDTLLALGADLEHEGKQGMTPLMTAAERGRADIVGRLLAAGADPRRTDPGGWSALTHAVYRDRLDVVELLLSAARGQLDLVLALVRHGADVNATTADGITAWQVATGDDVIRALQEARSHATTGRRFAILAADPAAAPRRQSRSERN